MSVDDAYDLMPDELAGTIPRLYSTKNDDDPMMYVKWFAGGWTWYISEYDPEERLCFGLVVGFEREFGYFSLDELERLHGPLGLPVERDLYFSPTPASKCQ